MTDKDFDPLFGAVPVEIPLPSAPLVTVLSQVRFPEIVSIQQKSFIAGFQELMRADYPLLQDDQIKTIAFDPVGTVVASDEAVWRFIDVTATWRLTLTSTFLALETRSYVSRADFIERLEKIVKGAYETLRPTHITRVGVRFVNRIPLTGGAMLNGMLRPEMMGIFGSPIRDGITHSMSEVACKVEEGQLLARWGLLPPGGTMDPEIVPPIKDPSWFLDVDAFADHQSAPIRFESEMIRKSAFELAARSYSFFRWAVTARFLEAFGGVTR